jgi:eukaryotic-like serine/threonine-protein kinase
LSVLREPFRRRDRVKIKSTLCLSLILLTTSFATAQVPCSGTILANPTLFVNWPQFQYDAGHTGCNPYESILKPSNVTNLALKWQHTAQAGALFSSPVVADSALYTVFTAGQGDYRANLWAVNPSTGTILWTFTTDVPEVTLSSPAVGKGLVYIGSSDHNVYALDAKTGVLAWQYTTAASVMTPTVANGVVYVGSDQVYALNASTGALIWKSAAGLSDSVPAVANGKVYVGSSDNNVYALDANTGAFLWSYATGGSLYLYSSPVVSGGKVYVGSDQVYALNASTGALVWKYAAPCTRCTPAVARGVLYIDDNFHKNVYALNASTGSLIWNYSEEFFFPEAVAVANGAVYVSGDQDSAVKVLDASSGALLWSSPLASEYSPPLAVVNGMVYVAAQEEDTCYLYAFSLNGQ